MPQQTIHFRIRPDGRVEEHVEGVLGNSCQQLTASVEARLGSVVTATPTADHYAAAARQKARQAALIHRQP